MATGKATRQGATPDSMAPAFTGDELRKALARYDRQPFMDVLAAWMECAPTPEEVIAFAAKKPDLYVKAIGDLARMAGFTDKREIDINHKVKLETMSDSQLEDRAKALAKELGLTHMLPGVVIDAEVVDITEDKPEEPAQPSPHTVETDPQSQTD